MRFLKKESLNFEELETAPKKWMYGWKAKGKVLLIKLSRWEKCSTFLIASISLSLTLFSAALCIFEKGNYWKSLEVKGESIEKIERAAKLRKEKTFSCFTKWDRKKIQSLYFCGIVFVSNREVNKETSIYLLSKRRKFTAIQ